MSKQVEINEENIVPMTAEQLNDEQRAEMAQLIEKFQNMYLQTYSRTRQGTLIQKSKVIMPSPGDGASTSAVAQENPVKAEDDARSTAPTLQDRIDSALHNALINQSGVLVNTLTNTVKSILDGSIHQYKPQGPIYLPDNKFPAYRTLRNDLSAPLPSAPTPPASAQQGLTLPLVLTKQEATSPHHINEDQLAQWVKQKQPPAAVQQPMGESVQLPLINQPSVGLAQPPPIAAYNVLQGYQQYSTGQYDAPNLNYHYQPHSPRQYRPGGYPQQQQYQELPQQPAWADMIAEVMRDQFGLKSKENSTVYRHPYPEEFDRVLLPHRYKIPDFSKFSGQDNVSTYEHISRFLA